jgi:hypothetical protein
MNMRQGGLPTHLAFLMLQRVHANAARLPLSDWVVMAAVHRFVLLMVDGLDWMHCSIALPQRPYRSE